MRSPSPKPPGPTPPGPRFVWIPAAIVVLALLNLSLPYRSVEPGPAYAVADLMTIDGAQTFGSQGTFLFTTVSLRSVTVAEAIRGWLDPVVDVVPVERFVPPGVTDDEADRLQQEQMRMSQGSASVAALSFLGYEVTVDGGGVRVEGVLPGAPAASVLRRGDVIVAAAGRTMCDVTSLVAVIDAAGVGAQIPLRVRRDGQVVDVAVPTMASDEDPDDPVVGIEITTVPGDVKLPLKIEIDSGDVGGPSAGLMFALTIVDRLSEQDLTGGRSIAGTGVISCGGAVGPVGGVAQKIAGAQAVDAEVFLAPADELRQACEVATDITVIGVRTLDDAVAALRDPAAAAAASCP